MFILLSGNSALVVDPCISREAEELLMKTGVEHITILLTHEHYDHISGVNRLKELTGGVSGESTCTVYASEYCADAVKDPTKNLAEFFIALLIKKSEDEQRAAEELFDRNYSCEADVSFKDRTYIDWEDLKIDLIATPGHSPGSICVEIHEKDNPDHLLALVTGDSLVQGNKVITRLPGGDKKAYREITRPYLESFPGDVLVLPGHGEISLMKDLELD